MKPEPRERPLIRPMGTEDFATFWPVFRAIVQARDSYAIDPDIGFEAACSYWLEHPIETRAAFIGEQLAGSYYLKANFDGPADHIGNCGFMVDPRFRGRGIARAMAEEALVRARQAGFSALQFNLVLVSNAPALHLWRSLGFAEIGRIPDAYRHRDLGQVDALVMYRRL